MIMPFHHNLSEDVQGKNIKFIGFQLVEYSLVVLLRIRLLIVSYVFHLYVIVK